MSSVAHVAIHESQFPAQVRRELIDSLRLRQVNHKFIYDSLKQTQKWLALHQAYSPSRNDAACAAIYDESFMAATQSIAQPVMRLIGLGCGGGQKDTRLLQSLRQSGKKVFYTPSDVSVAMALVAQAAAISAIPAADCQPLVCDLAALENFAEVFDQQSPAEVPRLITFFGMIPNFEPEFILPRLGDFVRPEDALIFSANLAPGDDYLAGIKQVLPLYDNALTRDWLLTFLWDLGVQADDGELHFVIEDDPAGTGLKRIAAYFHFNRDRALRVDEESFEFTEGESIRLFFSYRHTPEKIIELLSENQLLVVEHWVTPSGEEGVFLCKKIVA